MKDKNCTTDIFTNSFCQRKWLFHNLGEDYHASGFITLHLSGSTIYLAFQHRHADLHDLRQHHNSSPPLRAKALLTGWYPSSSSRISVFITGNIAGTLYSAGRRNIRRRSFCTRAGTACAATRRRTMPIAQQLEQKGIEKDRAESLQLGEQRDIEKGRSEV